MRHDPSHANDINSNDNSKQMTITLNQKNTTPHLPQAPNNVNTQDRATNLMLFVQMTLSTRHDPSHANDINGNDNNKQITIMFNQKNIALCLLQVHNNVSAQDRAANFMLSTRTPLITSFDTKDFDADSS